tara:strand:- start:1194 stop:1727 length:534 start_codon:yes stop_codon:yes gene_type:complete
MEQMKPFETQMMNVMIESVSYTGSAFGSNEQGATVFFNQRLVDKVSIDIGDIVEAYVIPNYEDKRDETPWRAIRASVVSSEVLNTLVASASDPVPEPVGRTPSQIEQEVLNFLGDEDVLYWTSSDLADAVDIDTKTIGNSCLRLFNKGLIAKADVHGRPNQERATFCLWARNAERFR